MSDEEYYAAVRAIGLHQGPFEEVFFTVNGDPVWVQPARDLSRDARLENIERLRRRLSEQT